jgi:peptidoglycan/xylan/chitin deacetylase (PgdA/CDA1 family)
VTTFRNQARAVARRIGVRRAGFAAFRMQCERTVLATTSRHRLAATGRVLCYHSVGTREWGVNDVTPKRFREHIELALRLGYRFVPARVVAAGKASQKDLAITFDDGLLSVANSGAAILADYGIPWTLFIVLEWIDGRHAFGDGVVMGWAEVERLVAEGVEIGSHSLSHPDFGALGLCAVKRELTESRRMIERRIGINTTAFAIPLGQSTNWSPEAHAAAVQAGYENVYAQSVLKRPAGTVPRTFITRFDDHRTFKAALEGAFDSWEEWL